MDYPTRRPKKRAPGAQRGDDRLELKLAEYLAPFGEEFPWRIAESDLSDLSVARRDLRPERGSLH